MFFLLLLFGIIGLPFVSFVLPESLSRRWILAAPQLGYTIVALFTGVMATIGLSVAQSSILLGVLIVGYCVFLALSKRRLEHIRTTLANKGILTDGLHAGILVVVVTVVSSWFMYGPGGHFSDPWGSGDFFFYWLTGDFLKNHDATAQTIAAQSGILRKSLDVQLATTFRPSSYTPLAFLSLFGGTKGTYLFINPILVLYTTFFTFCFLVLETRSRVKPLIPTIGIALCAMSYFGLRYNYVAQYSSLATCFFGFVILETSRSKAEWRSKVEWLRQSLGASIALVTAALCYDNQFFTVSFALIVFVIVSAYAERKNSGWKNAINSSFRHAIVPIGVVLVALAVASSRVYTALKFFSGARPLPGWEWHRLPFLEDVLGLAVPWTGGPPIPLSAKIAVAAVFGFTILVGLRTTKSPSVLALLAMQTMILMAALGYLFVGIGNASHAVWKAMPIYAVVAPFLTVIGLIEICQWVPWKSLRRITGIGVVLMYFALQILSLSTAPKNVPWYGHQVIDLIRRNQDKYNLFFNVPVLYGYFVDPIFRKTRPVGIGENAVSRLAACPANTAFVWDTRTGSGTGVIDSACPYQIGLPPRYLEGSPNKWVPWVIEGRLELPDIKSTVVVLLDGVSEHIDVDITLDQENPSHDLVFEINGTPLGTVRLLTGRNTYRLPVPERAKKECGRYSVITIRNAVASPAPYPKLRRISLVNEPEIGCHPEIGADGALNCGLWKF